MLSPAHCSLLSLGGEDALLGGMGTQPQLPRRHQPQHSSLLALPLCDSCSPKDCLPRTQVASCQTLQVFAGCTAYWGLVSANKGFFHYGLITVVHTRNAHSRGRCCHAAGQATAWDTHTPYPSTWHQVPLPPLLSASFLLRHLGVCRRWLPR